MAIAQENDSTEIEPKDLRQTEIRAALFPTVKTKHNVPYLVNCQIQYKLLYLYISILQVIGIWDEKLQI